MIVALNIGSGPRLSGGDGLIGGFFTIELEGSGAEPALLVEVELVGAHLMMVGSVVELGVSDQKGTPLVVLTNGVVSLGALPYCHLPPVIHSSNEFHASVGSSTRAIVKLVVGVEGRSAGGISVGSIGIGGTEHTHFVATIGSKTTIAHEEVIVVANVLDVGTFTTNIASSGNEFAEIGVAGVACKRGSVRSYPVIGGDGISVGIIAQSCILVEFEHEDTT